MDIRTRKSLETAAEIAAAVILGAWLFVCAHQGGKPAPVDYCPIEENVCR